ncbi:MAG: hypothetical protein JXR37_03265 [Kiritimatiellae bacterium]|nr:hypothetical protein [Kiritimatiellia bacterium]
MKNVAIQEVSAGDTIARDLMSSSGSLILAKGTQLSDSMIARLKKMNVRELVVEGQDAQSQEQVDALLAGLEARFAGRTADPYLSEMKRIVEGHIRKM